MTKFGDMGSQQGIRAVENGVAVGGKIRVYVGSGTPLATFTATEIGDLYMDYTNGVLYIATATGTGSWEPYTPSTTLKWKQSVKCATTTNGTFTTAFANGQTVDGYALVTGDRILIKNQSDQTVNGIYTVNATGAPTRAEDGSTGTELLASIVPVEQGTTNADSAWVNTNDTITLGSTNITYAIFGGLKAGTNLIITADVIGVDPSGFTASQLVRLNSGGTALEAAGATALGTNEASWTTDLDATGGKIKISAVGGGTNNTLTIQNQVLAGDVAITLPNATGTLATLAGTEALTGKTKVAVVSQSAAYNDSALQVGVYGSGIADTLLVDNILVSFVNKSGTNKTSADTSSMTLFVGNSTTAAVTNNKMQCILSSMTIAHNMYDAYAVQGHISVTDNCGTQNANAHVTGISGKFSVSTSKTLATGWATAVLGIVDGAGAVTQMCHVVSAVCEAGVTACQSLFHAYTDSTVNAAIQFNGTVNMTNLFDFDAAAGCVGANDIKIDIASSAGYIPYASSAAQFVTLTGAQALTNKTNLSITTQSAAYNNSALNVGKYGTAIADTLVADNILVSFVNSSGVNKTVADTSSMTLFVGNSTTGAVTNNKMQGVLSSMGIAHNVFDAYAGQFHTTISGSMSTQNANAHITGMSAKMKLSGTPTVTKGWLTAGLFIWEGAGTVSQMGNVVSIVNEAGSTGAQSMLHLNDDVGTVPYFSFAGADGDGKGIYTAEPQTLQGSITVLINGVPKYIPFYSTQHA